MPRLTPHREYVVTAPRFRIAFITHSARVIDAGVSGLGGSQYEVGIIIMDCPAYSASAVVSPGYARISLKPSHGAYGFALSYNVANANVGSEGGTSETLPSVHMQLTGKVISATEITGTIRLVGAPCTTPTYSYVAKLDPGDTKYIAPNA